MRRLQRLTNSISEDLVDALGVWTRGEEEGLSLGSKKKYNKKGGVCFTEQAERVSGKRERSTRETTACRQ